MSFLEFFWEAVAADLADEDRLSPDGLDSYWCDLVSEITVACISFPSPVMVPEAFFAAFIYRPTGSAQFSQRERISRYITLELGFDVVEQIPRTVLGEWDSNGSHRNLGTGPPAERESFLRAISNFEFN